MSDLYQTILECGHAANAHQVMPDGTRIPSCVICMTTIPAETQPDLTGRRSRCIYYGHSHSTRSRDQGDCKTRTSADRTCRCEVDSAFGLWFFEYRPDKPFDQFYCACMGFD